MPGFQSMPADTPGILASLGLKLKALIAGVLCRLVFMLAIASKGKTLENHRWMDLCLISRGFLRYPAAMFDRLSLVCFIDFWQPLVVGVFFQFDQYINLLLAYMFWKANSTFNHRPPSQEVLSWTLKQHDSVCWTSREVRLRYFAQKLSLLCDGFFFAFFCVVLLGFVWFFLGFASFSCLKRRKTCFCPLIFKRPPRPQSRQ